MSKSRSIPRPRLLPATIVVMALLLAVKSVGLVQAAAATAAPESAAAGGGEGSGAGSVGAAGVAAGGAAPAAPASPAPAPAAPPVAKATPDNASKATPDNAAKAVPGNAASAAPPVSDAERGLLLDLRHRRETLEGRARDLDQRQAVMSAAEQKLSARVAELTALQDKLDALEAARKSHDTANWGSLVKVYEAMKPRDAATIFDALDMQVLLGVLDRMAERKAAAVLAAMQPDRARLATQLLAEMRTNAVTPAGEKPPHQGIGASQSAAAK